MSATTQVVLFDYAAWAAQFPELATSIGQDQATGYFDMAGLYVDNSATSIIFSLPARQQILFLTTAHIAALLASINGNPPNPLVGRISNATEGTVSVATELPTMPTAAWWTQTRYGLMAWQAMAPYRTAAYIPPPRFLFPGATGFFGTLGGFRWP